MHSVALQITAALDPTTVNVDAWTNLFLKLIAAAMAVGLAAISGYAVLRAKAAEAQAKAADGKAVAAQAQADVNDARLDRQGTRIEGQQQQLAAVQLATPAPQQSAPPVVVKLDHGALANAIGAGMAAASKANAAHWPSPSTTLPTGAPKP